MLAGERLNCTVNEAKQRVTYQEFLGWRFMYSTGRWCSQWEHTGVLASTVANFRAFRKKTARVIRPQEFMPKYERQRQSDKQIENTFRLFTAAYNQALKNRRAKANG